MASMIESDIGRPRSGRPGNIYRPSRLVVLLGIGASVGVLVASTLGVSPALLVIAAAAAACGIAVVSYRQAGRGVVADALPPLAGDFTGPAIIDAPRAADAAAQPITRHDAA